MKILVFNQDWFAKEWREMGHEVVTYGCRHDLEVQQSTFVIQVQHVLESLPADFSPDVLVFHDNSMPVTVLGLEQVEIPTVFLSVDVHHHHEVHKYLSFIFDEVFVAQSDYIHLFEEIGSSARWCPLWATRFIEPSADKQYGATFVGTLNAKLNPERVAFFDALSELIEVELQCGKYWEIFPHAEIVLNQTVKGDLNFRVFEAMMSGSMLLTEKSGNGLFELFQDGTHLASYIKNDVDHAAELIDYYLARPKLCREIGMAGRDEILRSHTSQVRAAELLDVILGVTKKNHPARYFASAYNLFLLSNRLESVHTPSVGQALVGSLKAASLGIDQGAELRPELASILVLAACKFDAMFKSNSGAQLIAELHEAYPEYEIFHLARIRNCLNYGALDEATQLVRQVSDGDPKEMFQVAECAVTELIDCYAEAVALE